jgi:thiamine biosynthesis lipoprotein
MGMPITVEVVSDKKIELKKAIDDVFAYFMYIDETFSTYKVMSEINKINRGELLLEYASVDMKEIFKCAEQTKKETHGYFDIKGRDDTYDPSGIVKGWAIHNAAKHILQKTFQNFFIDAGGDIEAHGVNEKGEPWRVGIADPFSSKPGEYGLPVKVLKIQNKGVATSGTYVRGQHIYDPHHKKEKIMDIVSLTVIGPTIYDADRFATAAFAMGRKGIAFIEDLEGYEAYMIDTKGTALMTSGFEKYVI